MSNDSFGPWTHLKFTERCSWHPREHDTTLPKTVFLELGRKPHKGILPGVFSCQIKQRERTTTVQKSFKTTRHEHSVSSVASHFLHNNKELRFLRTRVMKYKRWPWQTRIFSWNYLKSSFQIVFRIIFFLTKLDLHWFMIKDSTNPVTLVRIHYGHV